MRMYMCGCVWWCVCSRACVDREHGCFRKLAGLRYFVYPSTKRSAKTGGGSCRTSVTVLAHRTCCGNTGDVCGAVTLYTEVCWLSAGCVTSQQHDSVSQGRISSDNCTSCHTGTEVEDQKFYLTQSQYTNTRPTSPSADPTTPGAWQGSRWSARFKVTGMTRSDKTSAQAGFEPRIIRS